MESAAFRDRIRSGQPMVSTMLSLVRNPGWQPVLAGLPFDFMCIDTEHSAFGDDDVARLISPFSAAGMPVVVRVRRPQWHFVTRVFDSGATGVLAPYCETLDEVREVIGAARWRPLKGAALHRAVTEGRFPSEATREHLAEVNRGNVVIIGIESVAAVGNLEAILGLDGIDAVFIGPADLSISMGYPREFDHPQFEDMVRHIIDTAHAHDVRVAANFAPLEQSVKWASRGLDLVIHAADFRLMHDACRRALAAIGVASGRDWSAGELQTDI